LFAAAAGVAALLVPRVVTGRAIVVELEEQEAVPGPEAPGEAAARDRTQVALRELKLAIVLFKSEHQRYPETLAQLIEPSPNFPRGFLEEGVVPGDGWGNEPLYACDPEAGTYRLWSAGPDGLDASGGGDDVRLN
jgi:hypothetical protein